MSTHTCWSSIYYRQGTDFRGVKSHLKYLQFRDDKDKPAQVIQGLERWEDRGLGHTYGQIANNLDQQKSEDVLAWTYLISPNPQLMALIPDDRTKRTLLINLTDEVVEQYYELRGYPVCPYSFVVHNKDTQAGMLQLHTHVVLPGTVETVGGREGVVNFASQGHLTQFNQLVERTFETHLDTCIGRGWRQEIEGISPHLPDQVMDEEANYTPSDDELDFDRWFD